MGCPQRVASPQRAVPVVGLTFADVRRLPRFSTVTVSVKQANEQFHGSF